MKKANPRETKRGITVECPFCGKRTLYGLKGALCEKCGEKLPRLKEDDTWAESKKAPVKKSASEPSLTSLKKAPKPKAKAKKSWAKKAPEEKAADLAQHQMEVKGSLSGRSLSQCRKEGPKPSLAETLRKPRTVDGPHLIIEARAGTGKTTTLIEGLKLMKGLPSKLKPSPQQKAVWDMMAQSKDSAKTVCFVAFNRSIADELKQRVPPGCDAMTMHSMGAKAVRKSFELFGGNNGVNSYRVQDIISELLETDIRELRQTKPVLIKATEELVSLCKMNLVDPSSAGKDVWGGLGEYGEGREQLSELAAYYDVDLNDSADAVFQLVPRVLQRCKDVAKDGCMDFNDMIWLPVALGLPVFQYDVLLVDEAQDLNRCQQALAKKAGRRLILCGDPRQAIYGFAGADCQSMSRMEDELEDTQRGVHRLPLTVTRRCGKAIVAEAKKIVPDFDAFASNPAGHIRYMTMDQSTCPRCNGTGEEPYTGDMEGTDLCQTCDNCFGYNHVGYSIHVQDGDMVLCRVNAPLVSQCFRFLKAGKKANIQGRDVGQGLISTIKKMEAATVPELIQRLSDWLRAEQLKENAKRNPSENRLIALQDRYNCLVVFCEEQSTVEGVIRKIESVFTDEKQKEGIRLSSIHKAKGLEANRVFLLRPKGAECPHPMAKSAWAKEQEMNLLYVAITRAKEELVYVS